MTCTCLGLPNCSTQTKRAWFCVGLLLLAASLLFSSQALAQTPEVDRLKVQLKAHPQADTGRVNRLNNLSQAVRNSDPALQCKTGQEALTLAKRLNYGAGQAQAYLHVSRCAMTSGQYKQAANYTQQALQLYRRLGDRLGQVNSLTRLSSIATDQGNYAQSIAYIQQSLVLVEPIPDTGLKAYINFLLAQNYTMLADYTLANSYATTGLRLAREAHDLNEQCRGLSILGIVSTKQGQYAAARRYYEQALPLQGKLDHPMDRATTEGNIAEVCVQSGQYTDAFRYGRRALASFQSIDATSYMPWIEDVLAGAYLRMGRLDSALVYARRSLRGADAGGMRDISLNANETLAQAYAQQGNYVAAFRHQTRYMGLKDSLRGEEIVRQTAALQYKFDMGKKESQIALLTKTREIEQQRSQYQRKLLYAAAIGVLLMVIIAVVQYRNMRVKQRVNELLGQQEEKLRTTQAQLRLQQEKERIARDLHDHVGAQLSVIASSLDHIRLSQNLNGSATHLEEIGNHARDAIGSLRETIWAINRENLPLGEFGIQVQQYINRQRQLLPNGQVELKTTFSDATQPLSSEQALNLFRIVQEAVGNAMCHARAETIVVNLRTDDTQTLQLAVTDNGVGFDQNTEHPGHYGLLNMQLRAERLGATWQVLSEIGRGTTLSLVMPLHPIAVSSIA